MSTRLAAHNGVGESVFGFVSNYNLGENTRERKGTGRGPPKEKGSAGENNIEYRNGKDGGVVGLVVELFIM